MTQGAHPRQGEQGYLLLALVVVVFILALFLTVAAPTVARSLERDKEVESMHRAQEYVRAIHNYYLKFNSYPTSVEQLLSQNNQHFLRQQYKDPLTGGDYKLIHASEAKTQVKGFFGEPLSGLPGSTAGGIGGGSGFGSSFNTASTNSSTSSGFSLGTSSTPSGQTGFGSGTAAGTTGGTTGSSSSIMGGTSATNFQGSKGMIVGVGSNASGHGLLEWNGSANIEDWEFLYDHRTWLVKQRVSIFGGSPGAGGSGMGASSGFGTTGFGSNVPTASGSGTGTSGTTTGAGTNSGANGSSWVGSGFGSSSSGTGTSPNQPR